MDSLRTVADPAKPDSFAWYRVVVVPSFHLSLTFETGDHFDATLERHEFHVVRADVSWSTPPGETHPDRWLIRQWVERTTDSASRAPAAPAPVAPVASAGDPDAPTAVIRLGFAPHPNPTRWPISLACSIPAGAPVRFDMVDIAGRMIARRDFPGAWTRSRRIGLDDLRLAPGVYWMRLRQGTRVVTSRLVVIR
jgi:hypothetical protein